MSPRAWVAAALVLAAVGWWQSPLSPRPQRAPQVAAGTTSVCPPPPRVGAGGGPLQTPVPSSLRPFELEVARLTPLAGFSIEARVLSRHDYGSGREADLSPVDFALGWGRMRDDAVLARLEISQNARFYRYRWRDRPPLPPAELVRSSANMHLIPSSDAVAEDLSDVGADDNVRLDGWLVNADAADGWRWRSSTTREDSGAGACELVYVCAVTRL